MAAPRGTPTGDDMVVVAPDGTTYSTSSSEWPSWLQYDANDEVDKAILAAYKAKGITPRDQADFDYWKGVIAKSGGLSDYWTSRMAQKSGGVGDYSNGTSTGGTAMAIDPSYLAPFEGAAPAPVTLTDFQAPTAESIYNDPSYLWRRDQGAGMLENSAASKGLLNSGGTLADMLTYGQNMASQEYSNVWNRDYSLWGAKNTLSQQAYDNAWKNFVEAKDTWYRNQSEPWSKLYQAASLGASSAQA
jgi:hypothetical protein